MNMKTIDQEALSNAVTHWLTRCPSHNSKHDQDPECVAGMMTADLTQDRHPDGMFALGFKFGMLVAAAVIDEPLGNPVNRIESALGEIRDELAEMERFRLVYVGDGKASAA